MNNLSTCLQFGVDAPYTRMRPPSIRYMYDITEMELINRRHVDKDGDVYTIVLPYTCIIAMSTVVKKSCRQITSCCRHVDRIYYMYHICALKLANRASVLMKCLTTTLFSRYTRLRKLAQQHKKTVLIAQGDCAND